MSIQALPESTTRRLGAGQALPSPAALVKELLDNAIDARATSIEVVLSANTLDKIEVRDNGSGIASDDLDQVGRRGHTSKLTQFEELRTVGRASLGFRGEALASACTMGEVVITTRTEGDAVGTAVKLKPTGGVETRASKSHPIGTTVCVSNLFSKFPVRKQHFLKQTSRSISEIKDLLQSYALARLHIRIGLKVLKQPKGNWTYISRPQDGLKEAAAKIVGKDVAAFCMEQTHIFKDRDDSNVTIKALLASPEADLSKIKGGCYASVDRRPLGCSRETVGRKMYSAYKTALKELARRTGQELCKDPFLCLAISCESDSYDPNVEPAKDDVIFASGDSLVTFMEELFRTIYPPPPAPPLEDPRANIPSETPVSVLEGDYDALLEQQFAAVVQERATQHPPASRRDNGVQDMPQLDGRPSGAITETPFIPSPVSPKVANDLGSILNPWTISNRSAAAPAITMQPPQFPLTSNTTPGRTKQQPRPLFNSLETPPASHGKSIKHILPHAPYNPSPFSALPSKPPPGQKTIESWLTHSDDESYLEGPPRPPTSQTVFDDEAPFGSHKRQPRQTSYRVEPDFLDIETPPRKQQKLGPAFVKAGSLSMGINVTPPSSSQPGGFTAVNAFSRPSMKATHVHQSSHNELPLMSMDDEPPILGHPRHPHQSQVSLTGSDDGDFHPTPANTGCNRSAGKTRGAYSNKPFQSHRRKNDAKGPHRRLSPGPDLPLMSLDDDEPIHRHPGQAPPLPEDDPIGHGTSEQALDFEHRKVAATRRLRDENALRDLDPNNVMRGVNQGMDFEAMMLAKMSALNGAAVNTATSEDRPETALSVGGHRPSTTLPHDDPRAFLMKRQRSMSRSGHRMKRTHTGRLPLETTPLKEEMHGVLLRMGIRDVNVLARQVEMMGRWDEYIDKGVYGEGLQIDDKETEAVEERIKWVMERWEAEEENGMLI